MFRPLSSLLCAALIGLAPAVPAQAQAFGDSSAFAPAKFGEKNEHLKTLLALQYQMQVLKRMIEREKSVNAMIDSAIAVGVTDPQVPKPDRALCEQIPANIACAQAYKGMYPNYSVEPVISAMPTLPPPASGIASLGTVPSINANDLNPLPGPQPGPGLYWVSVTCLQQECSAVLTPDPADPRARYRVTTGEKLPDGTVVSDISANGVTLDSGSKVTHLDPAPKA